jgi:nucleotide-binding universal stress UspA family protein
MNILVAVDLSPASEKVIEAARGVAELTGASIYVLHVVESDPDVVGDGDAADHEAERKRIASDFPREDRELQALVEKLQEEGMDATKWLVRGPAIKTTINESERLDAGLLVVGSHGHSAVWDVLIGSYSAGIIRKSKLPTLVVPILKN